MRVLKFLEFINEATLNLDELEKKIGSESRGDVLIRKLKNREELSTTNGIKKINKIKDINDEWVDIDKGIDNLKNDENQYDPVKAKSVLIKKNTNKYVDFFKDEDNNVYKLNQLNKTIEFGSKGPGRITKLAESLQCIFLGIKLNNRNIILNHRNMINFYNTAVSNGYLNNIVFLPSEIKITPDLITHFSGDSNWVYTFTEISNKICRIIDRNKQYKIFHIGYTEKNSPYVNIFKKYKEFSKKGDYKEINFAKYCPSDVYLIENNDELITKINKDINNTKDIFELTELLDNLFDNNQLISISLKKVINNSNFKIITNKEIGKDLPLFLIDEYIIGSNLKGIGSKIGTTSIWKYKNNKNVDDVKKRIINFDSSDTSKKTNIDGEIEGSSSRHGKISFIWIQKILEPVCIDFGVENIESYNSFVEKDIKELIKIAENLIEEISKIQIENPGENIAIREISRGTDISKSKYKLISRIQSLQVIYTLLQISLKTTSGTDNTRRSVIDESNKIINKIITKMFRYALSIETEKFSTPRYLRVI